MPKSSSRENLRKAPTFALAGDSPTTSKSVVSLIPVVLSEVAAIPRYLAENGKTTPMLYGVLGPPTSDARSDTARIRLLWYQMSRGGSWLGSYHVRERQYEPSNEKGPTLSRGGAHEISAFFILILGFHIGLSNDRGSK